MNLSFYLSCCRKLDCARRDPYTEIYTIIVSIAFGHVSVIILCVVTNIAILSHCINLSLRLKTSWIVKIVVKDIKSFTAIFNKYFFSRFFSNCILFS